ncbi:hypothetical protein SELMODRAFT_186743 [Selaginella moellendorffii]|uniref:VHS domain-containing protein n=1 Tax=Selaginella moellendorffii TaxID=88036 RepID=D8TA36_SELML|nr:UV-stimulated scaffold protein A homolog [Selaginella moellendorffii]EFJ06434.1 hypothetical protein SELMODRAFT_186743 [Selaginella moellendorffii]|eukprot:XP_002992496.1 UV-stimulated scaffold protein A homolog [Selaginella moellendorffii]
MAGRLSDLILAATNSPGKELEEPLLKAIKALVRASDDNVKAAADLLMDRLGKNHSQVRLLALLLIDQLFTRSKLFRGQIVAVLEKFMVLCLGHRTDQPLPAPADRAALLKAKALEIVERWNETFGPHYKELQLGYEYLKFTLRLDFPGVREAANRAEEEKNARDRRTQDLLRCRLLQLTENFPGLRRDLESTMSQLEECFAILSEEEEVVQDEDGFLEVDKDEEDSNEVFGIQSLRSMRDQEELMVTESRDNGAIFDMARDLLKLVTTRHLPAAQEWLSVLMRVDPEDRQSRDALMKEVIDLRNRLVVLKDKCQELGIVEVAKSKTTTDDDVEWEEEEIFDRSKLDGPRHKLEQEREREREREQGGEIKKSSSPQATATGTASSSNATMSELKQKLFEEAPVLPWGSFLDAWGSDAAVPANNRGLVLDNHWGRVDPDALISTEKMAEMQVRASYYQPLKSELRPCSAPLRNGGLCQRRDLRKCPLHGTIIPRDDRGNPLEEKRAVEAKGKEKAAVSPAALAAQAVRNVRGRDEAKRKQNKRLRQSQARTDRQHNEAVLRTAALAHDTQTIEAGLERKSLDEETPKKRKGGLSAMLRKKETPKDRIARRLLRGRAVDAMVGSIARDEDAKYRESFPNQW